MTDLELDEILTLKWPMVVRRVMGDASTAGFVRSFALSIARHARRPAWHPTPKQERIMRQMLGEFTGAQGPEPELIENT